jgi:hypothetical protein
MNRITPYLIIVIILVILCSGEVLACSCIEPVYDESLSVQVKRAKKESIAVFTGVVTQLTENQQGRYTTINLRVIDLWKGNLSKEITVLTGLHDGNCRYPFEVNKKYLIYSYNGTMYSPSESLETNICTRTTIFSEAKADIKILGKKRSLQAR